MCKGEWVGKSQGSCVGRGVGDLKSHVYAGVGNTWANVMLEGGGGGGGGGRYLGHGLVYREGEDTWVHVL